MPDAVSIIVLVTSLKEFQFTYYYQVFFSLRLQNHSPVKCHRGSLLGEQTVPVAHPAPTKTEPDHPSGKARSVREEESPKVVPSEAPRVIEKH